MGTLELSVVLPCLNEADTLAGCIQVARQALEEGGIQGEIIVADNGSSDGSPQIAEEMGARVVHVAERGYGAALMGGVEAAEGQFVLMGDADLSYDFGEIPRFVGGLRKGLDLVQGCRLKKGGGRIEPGAMPFLHRWVGNPLFSALARWWFKTPIHDIHCGMRGFRSTLFAELGLRCTGMEIASEMVIKATLARVAFGEIPITLHRDGRTSHPPHIRTFRDGWRHLRFFLLYSPRWLFLVPGLLLLIAGALGYGLAMPATVLGGIRLDVHTLLFSSLFLILGYQAILFALFTKVYGMEEGILPWDERFDGFFRFLNLEKGLILGGVSALVGLCLLMVAVNQWRLAGFGDLDYRSTMRVVIPGITLTALGVQTILSSFFLSILGLRRRRAPRPGPRNAEELVE